MIQIANISKQYQEESSLVLDNISFEIHDGETVSIIGPSGCGKTTLLYILGGLRAPSSGSVLIDGQEVHGPRRQTSFIFQDFGLLPWKTAEANARLSMAINGVPGNQQKATVKALFTNLGISGKEDSFPIQLSGGEKQRVAIARALSVNPDLLVMDEPFSALDAMTREKLQDIVLEQWRERQLSIVLVTHSIEEAVSLGKRIIILSRKPARIEQIIDNPSFGVPDFRLKDEYYNVVKQVRTQVDKLNQIQVG